ncbi:hypothetical protein [Streptomyces hiroshimensis]|uniref:Uncharacterized protein n=1 Tax=Streptomyces hiroshimensis TaxID=66424 RepID=A0ABQ2Y643_9ACTN|nr:hypothetical protein [Streptomyces hiroshimensis]GGX63037.1 hypothetical protein GCM10010324_04730 [Streptomyces hiroshimensis]
MELGEYRRVGDRPPPTPIERPDNATRFLANTLANVAAWRAAEAAQTPCEGAASELAARFTPQEFEHVVRLLADDGTPASMALLQALSNEDEERIGDVSAGEWVSRPAPSLR